jgi:hypothetical protein
MDTRAQTSEIGGEVMITLKTVALLTVTLTLTISMALAKDKPGKATTISGCICDVNKAQSILKVAPWNKDEQHFEAVQEFRYDDDTIISAGAKRTVSEISHGQALIIPKGTFNDESKINDVSALSGERAALDCIGEAGTRKTVHINLVALFAGESMPAMVGSHSVQVMGSGSGKCRCGTK